MGITPQSPPAYDEFIEFIVKSGGPEAVLAFRPSEATQDRAYALIYKEREGDLDAQEKAELSHYMALDYLFAMAKIRARLLLGNKASEGMAQSKHAPEEPYTEYIEGLATAIASEEVLARLWDTPEEDAAWAHLQSPP